VELFTRASAHSHCSHNQRRRNQRGEDDVTLRRFAAFHPDRIEPTPGYSLTTRSTHKLPSRLVIVRIRRYCFVIQEIGFVLGCTHTLEGPGWLVQVEEVC
jgi:hypothetical protein